MNITHPNSRPDTTPLLIELSLLVALLVFTWLVASSVLFQSAPELFGYAIMVDLTLTASACHEWLGIRRGGLPRWTFIPLIAVGLAISRVLVPDAVRGTGVVAPTAVALVECSVLVVLAIHVHKITRHVRAARAAGTDSFDALEVALLEPAPFSPRSAAHARLERQLWTLFLLGWFWKRRPADGPDVFTQACIGAEDGRTRPRRSAVEQHQRRGKFAAKAQSQSRRGRFDTAPAASTALAKRMRMEFKLCRIRCDTRAPRCPSLRCSVACVGPDSGTFGCMQPQPLLEHGQVSDHQDLLECKPCLLCGDHAARVVYDYPAGYYDHGRWETASWDGRINLPLSIVRCPKCDLMFSRPSFRAPALEHVYPQDLVEPELSFERALAQTQAKHAKMLAQICALRNHGSLCDVGTRYGVLPYLARQAGLDAFGVEYNAAAVRVAVHAGVPVYEGNLDALPRVLTERGLRHVDVFVLDDVLEHLVDPGLALQTLSQAQQPQGLLILKQMDLESLGHRVFRRHWYYLQPAAHMFYFNEHTLRALLDRAGYTVTQVIRPSLPLNLRRTLSRTLPGAAVKLARALARPKRKPSYLSCRLRSADDMFTVIAEKR